MRSFVSALLFSLLCTACTFVSTVRVSGSLDQVAPPSTPAAQALPKFADFLASKGLAKNDPATFGSKGHYNFHTYHGTRMMGLDQDDEYISVYAGDMDTVIVEVVRISDSVKPTFSDTMVEKIRSQTEQYLHDATGDTYKVIVIQHD